jgi:hypothetical protein
MSSIANIVGLLREASYAYYSGEEMMDNDTYDGILERLREMDPTNLYLSELGKPPSDIAFSPIICVTGQRSPEFETKAGRKNICITTILSPNVSIIVVPDLQHDETSTVRAAKQIGLPILTRSQFTQQYLS